ncbi:MAG TPA: LEPR-XLL domain-containing protein, partial [Solirubrobacteraceae bacterium]|nr:LEPR-XLL domain-containing protein [Solirubrobacteraceae bacterium]
MRKLSQILSAKSLKPSVLGGLLREAFARWSRAGRAAEAAFLPGASAPRESYVLEPLEPRLLLSADISYAAMGVTSGATSFTMKAVNSGSGFALNLYNGTSSVGSVALSAGDISGGNLTVNIDTSRASAPTSPDNYGDTLSLDLGTFAALNGLFSGTNNALLSLNFQGGVDSFDPNLSGGTPTGNNDQVILGGTATAGNGNAIGYGLDLVSSSDILVGADTNASLSGDLTLQSDSSIAVTGNGTSTATLDAANITLDAYANQPKQAVDGVGFQDSQNSEIALDHASLTATSALTLDAHSEVTATANGLSVLGVSGVVTVSNSGASLDVKDSTLNASTIDLKARIDGTITATAESNNLSVAAVTGSADPSITIEGGSTLTAGTSLQAAATSNVTIDTEAAALTGTPTDASGDAAGAVTTFTSGASLGVSGTSQLDVTGTGGNATLSASSTLGATTYAHGNTTGASGATVAVAGISGDTTAAITGDASVSAATIGLGATSSRTITTTADSTPGGASSDGTGSANALSTYDASTSQGSVSLAGAVAVSSDTGTTSAYVQGDTSNSTTGVTLSAPSGSVSIDASSTDVVSAVADGSGTGSGATGVGVAVAIDNADLGDLAYLEGNVSVTASSLYVGALAPAPSSFSAAATAGSGGASNVGVAGALAINIALTKDEAYIESGSAVNVNGANVTLQAQSDVSNSATAQAAVDGSNATAGVGASVALDIGENTTLAQLQDTAGLSNAGSLTLTATSAHAMQTDAKGGGQGAATAVTPVIALSVSDNNTQATLGTAALAALNLSGDFNARAQLASKVETTAEGDTNASKTGVGVSVALTIANDSAIATTARNITAAGAIAFLASTISVNSSSAKASVAGGKDEAATPNSGTDQGGVNNEVGNQMGFADGEATNVDSKAKGTDGAKAPSAEGSGGAKVQVAGAVGVTVATTSASATIPDGLTITANGGALTLTSANGTDASATADGSQTASGGTGIGAAVAVNVATVTNQATIGNDIIKAQGVTLQALDARTYTFDPSASGVLSGDTLDLGSGAAQSLVTGDAVVYHHGAGGTDIGGLTDGSTYYVNAQGGGKVQLYDTRADALAGGSTGLVTLGAGGSGSDQSMVAVDGFAASATSGASGGDTGVAGSLALNIGLSNATAATIADGATVTVSGGGAVDLQAQNYVSNTADAKAAQSGGTKLGIGASIALNIGETTTTAAIGALSSTTGVTLDGSIGDVSLSADSSNAMETSSDGGAASSKTAVTPVIAISVSENDTEATLGVITGGTLTLGGAFSASATHAGSVSTTATGNTEAGTTGIGVSVALTIGSDTALATTSSSIDAGGAVSFTASVQTAASSSATASVAGGSDTAATQDSGATQKSGGVDQEVANQQSFADSESSAAGGNKSGSTDAASAQGSGGAKVQVAGAIGVTVETSSAKATLPDGLTITSGGVLTLASSNHTDASAMADGSATSSGGGTGIGAAVAVNVVTVTNQATIGKDTINAQGVTLQALDPAVDTFAAHATSGASGADTGVAGSLALNIGLSNATAATIADGATVTITSGGSGAVDLQAQNYVSNTADAKADQSGGKTLGIGASIALNIGETTTTASIGELASATPTPSGVTLSGSIGDVSLSADSSNATVTSAEGGSAASTTAVTPVIAISVSENDTQATLGVISGGTLSLGGAFSASASHAGSVSTSASGNTEGGTTGVGVSLALTIGSDTALATTSSSIDAGGAVSFTASVQAAASSSATASVSGGSDTPATQDSGATQKSGGVDQEVANQQSFADSESSAAGGNKSGSTDAASAKTSGGSVQVAGAIGVTVETSSAQATLPDNLTITSGGVLTLSSANGTDASASADGSQSNGSGTGIGAAVAVNVATVSNQATIGKDTINAQGVTLQALDARTYTFDPTASGVVTGNTVDLGSAAAQSLVTGDAVVYHHGASGTDIGGLTDGSTYYVNAQGGGKVQLYDTRADALAGGSTGLVTLGSGGSGSAQSLTTIDGFSASATSGASGGSTGVAGSLALNIGLSNATAATIADGATVTITSGGS